MKPIRYYNPPAKCDVCRKPITSVFYDAHHPMGAWANMCAACFRESGASLGIGRGQRYRKCDDGNFYKT